MSRSRSLTRSEFEAVIRRATELATSDPESTEGSLTEEELFRIAGEVGLSEEQVRRALAEVRSGLEGGGPLDRIFGPSQVHASRVVPLESEEVASSIDEFLVASQLLQPVRRTPKMLQYRPAVDWASQLARAASFSSREHYIASARSVEVLLEPLGTDRTRVELVVDPGSRGDDAAGALVGGGLAGAAAGGLAGWAFATVAPLGVAVVAGLLAGGGVWAGVTYAMGVSHKRKVAEVRSEAEGVLDALEVGGTLEPPPPSWRRWVKRHFHGMARDFNWEQSRKGDA